MKSLDLKESVVFSWGITYIACSIIKPDIFGTTPIKGLIMMFPLGLLISSSVLMVKNRGLYVFFGSLILIFLGIFGIFAGVASWSNMIVWNVETDNQALLQVSMATYDFVVAFLMLNIGTEKLQKSRINIT